MLKVIFFVCCCCKDLLKSGTTESFERT